MESRYVCRSLEDAIGATAFEDIHPHSLLLRRLRFAYLEKRDASRILDLEIRTLASVAGNSGIDPHKAYNHCRELLQKLHENLFPYIQRKSDTNEEETRRSAKEGKYDRYFKILREMDRKSEEKRKAEEALKVKSVQTAQETTKTEDGIMVVRR